MPTMLVPFVALIALTLQVAALAIIDTPPTTMEPETPSMTSPSPHLLGSETPVDPRLYPDWRGDFDPDDCIRAEAILKGRVDNFDPHKVWTFWSPRWAVEPRGETWELPFGWSYGTFLSLVPLPVRKTIHIFSRDLHASLPHDEGFRRQYDSRPFCSRTSWILEMLRRTFKGAIGVVRPVASDPCFAGNCARDIAASLDVRFA